MTLEEADGAIDTLTCDLFKMLVMRRMSHRVGTPINDHHMMAIEHEAAACGDELRRRNDVFANLPRLYVNFDRATCSLVLRWAGELS